MSAHHAVAAVTQVIRSLLITPVDAQVAGATVSVGAPGEGTNPDPDNRVNLFLYRVSPNASLRSLDLPTRRSGGAVTKRPTIALDLHYLLTFFGDETSLVPQRLLGTVLSTLHASPMLAREQIVAALPPPDPLSGSGLEVQPELVKLEMEAMGGEELMRLWSTLLQAKYSLSVTYRASTVMIEEPVVPVSATPVEEPRVHVVTISSPRIESVAVDGEPGAPITVERALRIEGSSLSSRPAEIWFGGASTASYDVGVWGLRATPPADVRAGIVDVRVVHPVTVGDPPRSDEQSSNAVSIRLRPVIDQVPAVAGGVLSVDVLPPHHLDQTVVVALESVASGEVTRVLVDMEQARILAGLPEGTTTLSTVMVTLPSLSPGDYRVRLEADGARNAAKADGSVPVDPEAVIP